MTAVVIGSYCSDFVVYAPTSASDFCFYRGTNDNGATYFYLTSNVAMKNTAAATTDQLDDIKIIPSTFYRPTNGEVTPTSGANSLDWFTELKFKPIWSASMSGDFTTPIIPADDRRFLSSTLHTTFSTTEANRFVKLETKNNNTGRFKFSGSAVTDATAINKFRPQTGSTSTATGLSDNTIQNLVFTAHNVSPTMSTGSTKGVYIVVKSDWDTRTNAVSASKQLRYLVYDSSTGGGKFRLVDLYDPDITESIVKSCCYRITNGEFVTLSPTGTVTDSTVFASASKSSTWGLTAYHSSSTAPANFLASTSFTIPAFTSESEPTSTTVVDMNSRFFNSATGTTTLTDFTSPAGVASTLNSTSYVSDGFEGSSITKSVEYIDHTNGYANTSDAGASRVSQTFVFVTQVFDKRVEELFTNVNVTLLRLVQPSSGVSTLSLSDATATLNSAIGTLSSSASTLAAAIRAASSISQATTAATALDLLVTTAANAGGVNLTTLSASVDTTATAAATAAGVSQVTALSTTTTARTAFTNARTAFTTARDTFLVASGSTSGANDSNYLGLENIIPSNTLQADDGTTATVSSVPDVFTPSTPSNANSNKGIGLIVRDYFKFANPARATQFKFYDLGNNSEYIWQANFQAGAANAYAYITLNGSNQIQYRTKISTVDQRGWILEYDNTMTPPAVRLKWAATGVYLDVAKHNVSTPTGNDLIFGTDSAPLKADGLTFTDSKASAAIFNCIVCSSIDATGACMPITIPDSRQGSPAGAGYLRTSPVPTQVSISSPSVALIADSSPFRLKAGSNYIRYALSQFSSPTTAVISGALDNSPSPVPDDPYVSEFILTQQGGVMSDNTRAKTGFFIKASTTLGNYYLRTDPNTGNVRMVSTNLPSDMEGYAWVLLNNNSTTSNKFNLLSVPFRAPSSITTSTRWLAAGGGALGGSPLISGVATEASAIFTYESTAGVTSPAPTGFLAFRNPTIGATLTVAWAPTSI